METDNDKIIERLKTSLSLGNDDLSRKMEERLRAEAEARRKTGGGAAIVGAGETATGDTPWRSLLPEEPLPAQRTHWFSLTPEECGEGVVEWRSIVERTSGDDTGPIPVQAAPAAVKPAAPPHLPKPKSDIIYVTGILVEQPDIYRQMEKRRRTGFIAFLLNMNAWSFSTAVHIIVVIILMGAILIVKPIDDREVVSIRMGKPAGVSDPLQDKGDKGDKSENAPAKKEEQPVKKEEIKETQPETNEKIEIVKQPSLEPPVQDPVKTETPNVEQPSPGPVTGGTPSGGSRSGATDPLAGRGGSGKGEAVEKFGGNKLTEAAVERGLQWLKRHQSDSGFWSATRYADRCPNGDMCSDKRLAGHLSSKYDTGLTALALLGYLGAGHTHKKEGVYQETVDRAIRALVNLQQPSGIIDFAERNMYNHTIATLALAEAYAMTSDRDLRRSVKKAVQYLEQSQQMGGGWDYHDDRTDRNDVSITGWAVMALRAASIGGIEVTPEVQEKIRALIERRTKETGEVVYVTEGSNNANRKGNGMVAVGLVCRLYLGMKDPGPIALGADRLLRHRPDWNALEKLDRKESSMISMTEMIDQNMYYWYYGTLAMFHLGGDHWRKWNDALRDTLVEKQRLVGCREGSWDPLPYNSWISQEGGGRICSTALNILDLEIYYRYVPLFASNLPAESTPKIADPVERLVRQITAGKGASQTEKTEMLNALVRVSRDGLNDRLLVAWQSLVNDGDSVVRWKAIIDLIGLGRKEALPMLQKAYAKENVPAMKGTMLREFGKCFPGEKPLVGFVIAQLETKDEEILSGAVAALKGLTGQPFDTPDKWKEWWKGALK